MACSNLETMVTTVIATYRRPKPLQRAIKSVSAQTYPHFQVCVYDNASGDETAAVVRELAESDPRVNYCCHTQNMGAFSSFSYGIEQVATPSTIALSLEFDRDNSYRNLCLTPRSLPGDAVTLC
jgi:glycosyltransferase involved in cell wall biosynthesis